MPRITTSHNPNQIRDTVDVEAWNSRRVVKASVVACWPSRVQDLAGACLRGAKNSTFTWILSHHPRQVSSTTSSYQDLERTVI